MSPSRNFSQTFLDLSFLFQKHLIFKKHFRPLCVVFESFHKERRCKLFPESFAASILAFAEPTESSDINCLPTYYIYMNGFRRCS